MRLALAVFLLTLANGAIADEKATINMSDEGRLIHPQPHLGRVPIEPAFEDYMYMLYDTCDAVELDCTIFPMMGEINNAVAYRNASDALVIVYDRRLNTKIGGDGADAVIAHELGHHYCQHLTARRHIDHWQIEREADAFMGFAMNRRGYELRQLIGTYEDLGIDRGSKTHPPFELRVAAISRGFAASSLDEVCDGAQPK